MTTVEEPLPFNLDLDVPRVIPGRGRNEWRRAGCARGSCGRIAAAIRRFGVRVLLLWSSTVTCAPAVGGAGIGTGSPPTVETHIQPWPGVARAAVSITFDDAYPSHAEVAAPMLEDHGFRGTFYLIVDKLFQRGKYRRSPSASIETWQAAARRGHEMGSHTMTHEPLDELTYDQARTELHDSREALENLFVGMDVVSLAYPFSRTDALVRDVTAGIYTSGRLGPPPEGAVPHNDPLQLDLLELESMFLCTGDSPAYWNEAVERAVQEQGWLIETLHAMDEDGFCRISAVDFAAHLAHLSSLADQIWVAPVSDVVRRLEHWRNQTIEAMPRSDWRVDLVWQGPPPAASDWQITVHIAPVDDWRIVDEDGRQLPVRRRHGAMHFTWPARQDRVILETDRESTGVESGSWGRMKQCTQAAAARRYGSCEASACW